MKKIIFILCLIFNITVFYGLFDIILINFVLIIQGTLLTYHCLIFIICVLKIVNNAYKANKIDKKDKEKFVYYSEIMNEYSIGELGYIYNGRRNTNELIIAELEYLKHRGNILIDNKNIKILNSQNLRNTEKFILERYKFINTKEFKSKYLSIIESSLKEKKVIENLKWETESELTASFLIMIISFFISWFLMFNFIENMNNSGVYALIEMIMFLLTWLISFFTMISFNNVRLLVKTDLGQQLYMRLNGLKKYIKDFGNFEKRKLEEITLWEDYVLYAIILNEGNSIKREAKEEYQKLLNIIWDK